MNISITAGWSPMERSVVEVTKEKQIYSILYRYVGGRHTQTDHIGTRVGCRVAGNSRMNINITAG